MPIFAMLASIGASVAAGGTSPPALRASYLLSRPDGPPEFNTAKGRRYAISAEAAMTGSDYYLRVSLADYRD
jgi:hypothetical protein